MASKTLTFHHSIDAGALARTAGLALVLVLTAVASGQGDPTAHARLVLAADQIAACAGQGHAATAHGTTIGEHSPGSPASAGAPDGYWNPFARVAATIAAVTPEVEGCWLDTSVAVDVFRHGCVYTTSATLMAGDRPLASTSSSKARADETLQMTWRSRIPNPSALSQGVPVYVDVRITPVVSACGG